MKGKEKFLTCQFCKKRNIRRFLSIDSNFSLYKCNNCKIVFTHPQPNHTQRINEQMYDSRKELQSRIANFAMEYKRAKKHILSFMKYKKSGRYLDVGCSYGVGLRAAQDLGFRAVGIEPTKKAAEYAKKHFNVEVIQNRFEKAKIKSNSYDIISLYDVLEHIPSPKIFLKEVKRILKPKGLLVIQSPNIKSFAFMILKNSWNWLLVPNHLWHFSKKSIEGLLDEEGFAVKSYKTNDDIYDFASNLKSKIFFYKTPMNLSEKFNQKIIYFLSYGIIFLGSPIWSFMGKGGSFQVYAIKK